MRSRSAREGGLAKDGSGDDSEDSAVRSLSRERDPLQRGGSYLGSSRLMRTVRNCRSRAGKVLPRSQGGGRRFGEAFSCHYISNLPLHTTVPTMPS
jgi:hypothetical protein